MPTLSRGFNRVEPLIAKTMEYLSIPSVVGSEQTFMNHLSQDFKGLGLQVLEHNGLLEICGKNPGSAIICAHTDRHGLISIGNNEYTYAAQYMKEIKYGENSQSSRSELASIAKRFEGERVFAYDPKTGEHLGKGIIESCDLEELSGDSLFYINGMEKMPQGTPIAYARTARAEKKDIKGQIDNTLSLGVVYRLFQRGFQGTALLTTEEEIGKSWMHLSSWLAESNIETKSLLVLDTSPYVSRINIEEGFIVLRNRDKSAVFNADLTAHLENRCNDLLIPFEYKDVMLTEWGKEVHELGSTELGKLVLFSEGRWNGATIQIPTISYHTSNETTTRRAIRNYYDFLHDILIAHPLEYLEIP